MEHVRSALEAFGVFSDASPMEVCLVVVPSHRLKSGEFAVLLHQNKIHVRTIGHGSGNIRDRRGVESRVKGLLVLTVNRKELRRTQLFAKLFGVTAMPVDSYVRK